MVFELFNSPKAKKKNMDGESGEPCKNARFLYVFVKTPPPNQKGSTERNK